MEFDTFEDCFNEPGTVVDDKPQYERPPNGQHVFAVKDSVYYDDSRRWRVVFINDAGQSIAKTIDFTAESPRKKQSNKAFFDAAFPGKKVKKGMRLIDWDWSSAIGATVEATVERFTPQDKEEEVAFVSNPLPLQDAERKAIQGEPAKDAGSEDFPF